MTPRDDQPAGNARNRADIGLGYGAESCSGRLTVDRMSTEQLSPDKLCLERLPQVLARTGLSRAGLYRLIASGQFAQPVRLTARSCAWPSSDVDAFIERRSAARDGKVVRA